MRRKILLSAALLLGILLTACGKGTGNTEQQTSGTPKDSATEDVKVQQTEDMTENTTEEAKQASGNLLISIVNQNYDTVTDDGEYFWGDYDIPIVESEQYEKLSAAVTQWKTEYEQTYIENAKKYEQDAKSYAEESNDPDFYGYSLCDKLKVVRADERVASLTVDEAAYTDGVHGSTYLYGVSFDSQTGEQIRFADLGEIRESIILYLQDYFTDNPSDLFDSDECLEIFENKVGNDDAWFLTGEGLAIIFNEYEINSYAAGRTVVIVPYGELTGFHQGYLPMDDAGFTELYENKPVYADTNGDGEAEEITLAVYYSEDGGCDAELKVNDSSQEFYYGSGLKSGYFIRTKEKRCFVMVDGDEASDDYVIQLIEVTDGTARQCDQVGGAISAMSNEVVLVNGTIDVLGTYQTTRHYTYTSGSFTPVEERYTFINNSVEDLDSRAPKLKKPVKVKLGASEGSELVEEELPAGTVIYPYNSDGETVLGFMLEDGRYGEIIFERTEEGLMMDGVSEWDLFDNLPYAG